MTESSLTAAYFDGIFASSDDPWDLATSPYESAKFAHTRDSLADRHYARGFEIGCAHGVLTGYLTGLCDSLLAVDISATALARAQARVGDRPGISLQRMAFPKEVPATGDFDLVILSEVAYYWDHCDLDRAGEWLRDQVVRGGRIILVHYLGETDYPHSGDAAVAALWDALKDAFDVSLAERTQQYRLDLWEKR